MVFVDFPKELYADYLASRAVCCHNAHSVAAEHASRSVGHHTGSEFHIMILYQCISTPNMIDININFIKWVMIAAGQ